MISSEQKKRIYENRVSLVLLFAIALLGVTTLTGWLFHIPVLIRIIPGLVPMQFNAAVCFVLLAVCGAIKILYPERRVVFGIGVAFVLMIGLLTVFEFLSGISLGID